MSKHVKSSEKIIKDNISKGKMGEVSIFVDIIMYFAIVFVLIFGYVSFKKLKDYGDVLVF
jgi:hypothetical protein